MFKLIARLFLIATCFAIPSELLARGRSNRDGFNFGTSFGYQTADDRNFSSNVSATKATVQASGSSVSPYIGYVVSDHFNLGLSASFNTDNSSENETNSEFQQRIERDKHISTKSMNLISRFLFGEVMFFELGAGVYDQGMSIENNYTSEQGNGAFNGRREKYSVRGVGTGYHMGGGFEVPMSGGFYFTSAYLVKVYNLRNYRGNGDLGARVGFNQRRDISFGLSHYLQ